MPIFNSVEEALKQPDQVINLQIILSNVTEISPEIGRLTSLQFLGIEYCKKLKTLPAEIGKLKNLKELRMKKSGLVQLPSEIGNLIQLEVLDLSYNPLVSLPETIGGLKNLRLLELSYTELHELPSSIGDLSFLRELGLVKLKNFTHLPPEFSKLARLKTLAIESTAIKGLIPILSKMHLKELYAKGARLSKEEVSELFKYMTVYR